MRTTTQLQTISVLLLACVLLASCGTATLAPTPAPARTATPVLPATPALNLTPVLESPEFFVRALVTNEAIKHTGAAPESVGVVRVEARTWPDAALGCPQPGQAYAQATVSGWLVEVKAINKTLEYHTDQNASKIVLCQESG